MKKKSHSLKMKREPERHDLPAMWEPLRALRGDMNHLFDDFFSRRWPMSFGDFPEAFTGAGPAVDIVDKDRAVEIRAELPGMDEKDIDLRLTDNMITIRGEKRDESEKEGEEGSYFVSERRYGAFERSFRLPDGIDANEASAKFRKGVLTVTLPKTAEARDKTRKIEIHPAS